MGKRQIRILQQNLLAKKNELEGITGHVILRDHVVHHGRILEILADNLSLENARSGRHQLPMTTIAEVVFDQETEY